MSALGTFDAELERFASDVGTTDAVAVMGGKSRWDAGGAPAADVRLVVVPSGIIAYQPDEMTVQVRAGTAVADLQAALAESGQRVALPARVGSAGPGTVGGAISVGENVLDRLGRGSLRDSILQVRYVSAEGKIITSGGPVVKNVSGFNLPKLLCGSLGTLGLVGEVVLRTNPIPAVAVWLASNIEPSAVLQATLRPAAVLADGATTWIKLEGHGADVAAETAALAKLGTVDETAGPPLLPPHRWLCAPASLGSIPETAGAYVASFGVGTVFASTPQPAAKRSIGQQELATRLKALFDPTTRLNPGRNPEIR